MKHSHDNSFVYFYFTRNFEIKVLSCMWREYKGGREYLIQSDIAQKAIDKGAGYYSERIFTLPEIEKKIP